MTFDWWTLGIQAVNVAILVWLLARFFWRPLAAMIAERRAASERSLVDAKAKRAEAMEALKAIDITRTGMAKEREAILAEAHSAAAHALTTRLADAESQAAVLRAAAQAEIAKERDSAEKAWAERASRLAVEIAGRLVARLDGAVVHEAFLDWLVQEIRKLPEATRQTMTADGAVLETLSASPLAPDVEERSRTRIAEALGAKPEIVFKVDPTLIAGLELRGLHLVVSNSWRADLDRILTDLTHDDQH